MYFSRLVIREESAANLHEKKKTQQLEAKKTPISRNTRHTSSKEFDKNTKLAHIWCVCTKQHTDFLTNWCVEVFLSLLGFGFFCLHKKDFVSLFVHFFLHTITKHRQEPMYNTPFPPGQEERGRGRRGKGGRKGRGKKRTRGGGGGEEKENSQEEFSRSNGGGVRRPRVPRW